MKTNFAYIDEVMDRAIADQESSPTLSTAATNRAKASGVKSVAGFRVVDEKTQHEALDKLVQARVVQLEKFKASRQQLRDKLAERGITVLASCPSRAWYKVCKDAELYIMHPDGDGRVGLPQDWWHAKFTHTLAGHRRYLDRTAADDYAKKHPIDLLRHYFPTRESVSTLATNQTATLRLPDPPRDVQDILLRTAGLTLHVAAVAEAISLVETPSAIYDRSLSPRDRWAQEQGFESYAAWYAKHDPIIFVEENSVCAIIAQFGDFPIEQKVVDGAISAEHLLEDPVTEMKLVNGIDTAPAAWFPPPAPMFELRPTTASSVEELVYRQAQAQGLQQGFTNANNRNGLISSSAWTGR